MHVVRLGTAENQHGLQSRLAQTRQVIDRARQDDRREILFVTRAGELISKYSSLGGGGETRYAESPDSA